MGVFGLEKAIAALGANSPLGNVIRALRDADWCAVVIVAHAHAFEILGIEHVMLVVGPAARLGLAEGALPLGARTSIGAGGKDGEVPVAAVALARRARGLPAEGGVLG